MESAAAPTTIERKNTAAPSDEIGVIICGPNGMRKDSDSGKLRGVIRIFLLCVCMAASLFADEKAAASYLDGRFTWWMSWPTAARDHGTFCVSCHTVLPYALARPALRGALAEENVSPVEQKLLDNVVKRVR